MALSLSKKTLERLTEVTTILIEWYAINQRSFIWRKLRRTPYVVMVSEFMLQQTQAQTIEKRLPIFLKQFPTIKSLAEASTANVLKAWQGLGYNRRALHLKHAAEALAERGSKPFPQTVEELIKLPGIGRYTASAILTFSFKLDIPVVDVNIERVLSRVWKRMPDFNTLIPIKTIEELDAKILPKGKNDEWHQALMDLGATVCTKRNPNCGNCPVLDQCASGPHFERNRETIAQLTTPKRGKEQLYFGQPKRIWRGRVLKEIAKNESRTLKNLCTSLSKTYTIDTEDFRSFVQDILHVLEKDGLISTSGSSYRLTA